MQAVALRFPETKGSIASFPEKGRASKLDRHAARRTSRRPAYLRDPQSSSAWEAVGSTKHRQLSVNILGRPSWYIRCRTGPWHPGWCSPLMDRLSASRPPVRRPRASAAGRCRPPTCSSATSPASEDESIRGHGQGEARPTPGLTR